MVGFKTKQIETGVTSNSEHLPVVNFTSEYQNTSLVPEVGSSFLHPLETIKDDQVGSHFLTTNI